MKVKEAVEPNSERSEIERHGRDLDAEVAEKIMGWTRFPEAMHPTDNRVPRYSTGIAAAMEVVIQMRAHGWSFACTLYEGNLPYASFCKRTAASSRNAEAESLPEAICRAALAAVTSESAKRPTSDHGTDGQAS